MSSSYAQTFDLTCPQCKKDFSTEAYIIVDTGERPDLFQKIVEESLHKIPCPNCGYPGQLDLPLLILRTEEEPNLLFSPAGGTSPEQDELHARQLIEQLKNQLGLAWQDSWLEGSLSIVKRHLLSAMLSNDPKNALRELAKNQLQDLKKLKSENPDQYLSIIVGIFLQTQELEQKRRLLEDMPELLSNEVDEILNNYLKQSVENDDSDAKNYIRAHQVLLAECRNIGVKEAFGKLMDSVDDPENDLEILNHFVNKSILSNAELILFEQVTVRLEKNINKSESPDQWVYFRNDAGLVFTNILKQTGLLQYAERAIQLFQDALTVARPPQIMWARLHNNLGNVRQFLFEANNNLDEADLAINSYEKALSLYEIGSNPWATTMNNLGTVYNGLFQATLNIDWAKKAEDAFTQSALASEENSGDWGMAFYNLGMLYETWYGFFPQKKLAELAVESCKKAIGSFREYSFEWAHSQINLGSAYQRLYQATNSQKYAELSIKGFKIAQDVFANHPFHKVTVLANLSNTYQSLYDNTNKMQWLDKAIETLISARQICESTNQDYLRILDHLSGAYIKKYKAKEDNRWFELANATILELLKNSEPYTFRWGNANITLGTIWSQKYIYSGDLENAQYAEAAFNLALSVFSPPTKYWFTIQHNLEILNSSRFEKTGNQSWVKEVKRINKLQQSMIPLQIQENSIELANEKDPKRLARRILGLLIDGQPHAVEPKKITENLINELVDISKELDREHQKKAKKLIDNYKVILQREYEKEKQYRQLLAKLPSELQQGISRLGDYGTSDWVSADEVGLWIALGEELLREINPKIHLDAYNFVLDSLGNAYRRKLEVTDDPNWGQKSLKAYEAVLSTLDDSDPRWISIQSNIGFTAIRLYEITLDSAFFEKAHKHFDIALETIPSGSQEVATIYLNKGLAFAIEFRHHFEKNQSEHDLQLAYKAIHNYQLALGFYPYGSIWWCKTWENLAALYIDLYNFTPDLKWAREAQNAGKKALIGYEPRSELWASANHKLGDALKFIFQNKAERDYAIQSIDAYTKSLSVYEQQHSPTAIIILNKIGEVNQLSYYLFQEASFAKEAIEIFDNLLDVLPVGSSFWVAVKTNKANLYADQYEISRIIEFGQKGIKEYNTLLETVEKNTNTWANILGDMASLYSLLYETTGKPEYDKIAQEALSEALKIVPEKTFAWGMLHRNLGNHYRIKFIMTGDRRWVDASIDASEKSTSVFRFPSVEWARTANNIGLAYRYLFVLTLDDEWATKGIELYKKILELFPSASPEWIRTLFNLGTIYEDIMQVSFTESFAKEAEALFDEALSLFQKNSPNWLKSQEALINIYAYRYHKSNDLSWAEKAIKKYKAFQGLDIEPIQEINFLLIMGGLQRNIYGKCKEVNYLHEAISYYERAKNISKQSSLSKRLAEACTFLGEIYTVLEKWDQAILEFEVAAVEVRRLQMFSISPVYMQEWREIVSTLYPSYAFCLSRKGQFSDAVEILEQGRAQQLREIVERRRKDLDRLPSLGYEDLYENFKIASEEENLLQAIPTRSRSSDWPVQIEQVRREMQTVAETIRRQVGENIPEYKYFLAPLPYEEIKLFAKRKPLVYFASTYEQGIALIVSDQGTKEISLSDLGLKGLQNRIFGRGDLPGYLKVYENWCNNPSDYQTITFWQATLDLTTQWLWEAGIGELVTELKGYCDSVVLIPTGLLALLPLHAAWTEDESKPTKRRFALDELNISYSPSAHALWIARMAEGRLAESVMVVDNPDGTLHFSEFEIRSVLEVFEQSRHLSGDEATLDAVKRNIGKASVIHFSTHGVAGWQKAEQSRLKLADTDLILPDIFRLNLDQTRLVVLSACETGVPGLELIDEMIGLPSGMMQAGVPGVVGSLWSVSDMSTAILMSQFYRLWRKEGKSLHEGLRLAQIWLRDSTAQELRDVFESLVSASEIRLHPDSADAFIKRVILEKSSDRPFCHPFFWAAFTYTGI